MRTTPLRRTLCSWGKGSPAIKAPCLGGKIMKFKGTIKNGIVSTSLIVGVFCFASGCAHRRTVVVQQPPPLAAQEIMVVQAPPIAPPQTEVIPISPGRDYVWTPGHYAWKGDKYVWVQGKYVSKPRPTAMWEPGHWEHRRKGYYWVEGHWR